MELAEQKLITYLETVAKLEASVYEQEQSYDRAKEQVVYNEPSRTTISAPEKRVIEEPEAPFMGEKNINNVIMFIGGIVIFVIGLVSTIMGIARPIIGLVILGVFAMLFAAGLAIPSGLNVNKKRKEYSLAVEKYPAELEQAEREYNAAMEQYEKAKQVNEEKYKESVEKSRKAFAFAQNSLKQMVPPLEQTKAILQQYYDLDVIHPKYRNLPAVSTICEYFQTGRCTELTGPNGAYNLYESELRQNLIINHIENVISNLEQVKANQYYLYMELNKANKTISSIASTANALLKVSSQNAAANMITAYCSEVTAFNSTALTSLALFG